MMQGWKCPNCNSAHAPDVKTCPNSYGPFYPFQPFSVPRAGCAACRDGGVCGCVLAGGEIK